MFVGRLGVSCRAWPGEAARRQGGQTAGPQEGSGAHKGGFSKGGLAIIIIIIMVIIMIIMILLLLLIIIIITIIRMNMKILIITHKLLNPLY